MPYTLPRTIFCVRHFDHGLCSLVMVFFSDRFHEAKLSWREFCIVKFLLRLNGLSHVIKNRFRDDINTIPEIVFRSVPFFHQLIRYWAELPCRIIRTSYTPACLLEMLEIKQIKQLKQLYLSAVLCILCEEYNRVQKASSIQFQGNGQLDTLDCRSNLTKSTSKRSLVADSVLCERHISLGDHACLEGGPSDPSPHPQHPQQPNPQEGKGGGLGNFQHAREGLVDPVDG